MYFEWHDEKNKINITKHGVDFKYAIAMFGDRNRIEFKDARKDYGEARYITIGKIEDVVYTMVYTMRNKVHRVISVRRANRYEKQAYNS